MIPVRLALAADGFLRGFPVAVTSEVVGIFFLRPAVFFFEVFPAVVMIHPSNYRFQFKLCLYRVNYTRMNYKFNLIMSEYMPDSCFESPESRFPA